MTSPHRFTLRRSFVLLGAAVCLLSGAHAEPSYPARPITLVHPYAAGALPIHWRVV